LITRLGLRYVNLIEKEKFIRSGESWSDLINSKLVPELKSYMQVDNPCYIKSLNRDISLCLDGDNVNLKLAILRSIDTNSEAFLIDIDSFVEDSNGIMEEKINEYVKCFNSRTRNIFRPFITERLLQKLSQK